MVAAGVDRHQLVSASPDATAALGRALGAVAEPGDLICLWGELGAGKTHLAKAIGAALGVADTIVSPSFVLMAEYAGRIPMFHIDPYRLTGAEDALQGGLIDERQAGGLTIVEWPERLGAALPVERLDVRLVEIGDDARAIDLVVTGARYRRYLEAVR